MQNIYFFICVCIITIGFSSCKDPVGPVIDPSEPVANAGANQTINLGSYIILDGTKSTKGNGTALTYTWAEDSSNPKHISLFNDSISYKFVGTVGTYKYTLVVNNGIKDSKPAELVVSVNPKGSSVFTDLRLEAEIRSVLKKQTGDLTNSDLLSVDKLNIGSFLEGKETVSDLHGIENCKNLEQLSASLQSITDISLLSGLVNLEKLEVDQNPKITDISPIANLTGLKYLDINDTRITSINSLSNLINLECLYIQFTKVNDISVVSKFSKLKEFYGTNLPVIDLSSFLNLKDLETLFLMYGKVSDISALSNLKKLRLIDLSENQISDITPLAQLSELMILRMTDNDIKDISTLKSLTKLNDIWLSRNKIEDIKSLVENTGLSQGSNIMIDGNPLNSLSTNDYIPQLRTKRINVYW